MKRQSLSKKARFEVFKRDAFTCQYCGNKPPSVILEVDHIKPVASGGCNDVDNLVTACFDCNRGKGARTLDLTPDTIELKMEIQKEKADQLKQYEKMLSAKKAVVTRKVNKLNKKYISLNGNKFKFSESFKLSAATFLSKLTYQEVESSLELAFQKINDPEKVLTYFCGICWNKIRGDHNG